mmetsp:Transcript_19455/g.35245  ORF Transcript_19455/g.35245 Transcript_19455/m.35245 type:complete len:90 (-) Transcript_19455:946-1215(-)
MPQERTDPEDILKIGEDRDATLDAGVGIHLGIRIRFWDLPNYAAEPAVRAGIDVNGRVTCDGSLGNPSDSRFMEEPDETRNITSSPIPN